MIKRGDAVIIAAILVISLLLGVVFLLDSGQKMSTVEISVNGEVCAQLDLNDDTVYTVSENGHNNVIEISGGKVRMRSADCSDEICVGQGWIDSQGETIVCLPNRVTVTLKNTDTQIDAVAQ